MSELKNYRTMQVAVTPRVYMALKAVAEVEGYSGPDELADTRLGLLLSTEYDLDWLTSKMKSAKEKVTTAYKDRIKGKKDDDAIPGLT